MRGPSYAAVNDTFCQRIFPVSPCGLELRLERTRIVVEDAPVSVVLGVGRRHDRVEVARRTPLDSSRKPAQDRVGVRDLREPNAVAGRAIEIVQLDPVPDVVDVIVPHAAERQVAGTDRIDAPFANISADVVQSVHVWNALSDGARTLAVHVRRRRGHQEYFTVVAKRGRAPMRRGRELHAGKSGERRRLVVAQATDGKVRLARSETCRRSTCSAPAAPFDRRSVATPSSQLTGLPPRTIGSVQYSRLL